MLDGGTVNSHQNQQGYATNQPGGFQVYSRGGDNSFSSDDHRPQNFNAFAGQGVSIGGGYNKTNTNNPFLAPGVNDGKGYNKTSNPRF